MGCSESHHLLAERRTEDQVTRMMVTVAIIMIMVVVVTRMMVILAMLMIMVIVDNHD